MESSGEKVLSDKLEERRDLACEIQGLEQMIDELKVLYEQHFSGILPQVPDKQYAEVKRTIRLLMQAPFRNSALNYKLKALKYRFSTLDTYWQRVLKQKEDGTYSRDVFKANLREQQIQQEEREQTKAGAAENGIKTLFSSYCQAVEKQVGAKADLDYKMFQKSIVTRAKDFREKNAGKKLTFKVVVKNGKVVVQARVKE